MAHTNDDNTKAELAAIDRARLENMEADIREVRQLQQFIVAALPEKQAYVEAVFQERKGSPQLFLALEKQPHSQAELATLLSTTISTISRVCIHLLDVNFIQIVDGDEKPQRYTITSLAKRLKAVRIAEDFIKNGLPASD